MNVRIRYLWDPYYYYMYMYMYMYSRAFKTQCISGSRVYASPTTAPRPYNTGHCGMHRPQQYAYVAPRRDPVGIPTQHARSSADRCTVQCTGVQLYAFRFLGARGKLARLQHISADEAHVPAQTTASTLPGIATLPYLSQICDCA